MSPAGPQRAQAVEPPARAASAAPLAPTASPAPLGAALEARPGLRALLARLGVVAGLVVLDLWSKARVFAWLQGGGASFERDLCEPPHRRVELVGDWFAFMLSRNKGAAFGQLDGVPRLLVGGRILAVGLLLWMLWRTPRRRRLLVAALVLVLAGAVGNLYDNLFLPPPVHDPAHPFGYVRDFIDVYFPSIPWHFPTFNVADSCITVGAVLLLLSGAGRKEREPRASP